MARHPWPRGRERCCIPTTAQIASRSRGGSLVEVLPALSEQEALGEDDYHLRRLLYPYPPPPKISTRTTMISISSHILIALTSFGETQLLVVLSWAFADCCVAHSS